MISSMKIQQPLSKHHYKTWIAAFMLCWNRAAAPAHTGSQTPAVLTGLKNNYVAFWPQRICHTDICCWGILLRKHPSCRLMEKPFCPPDYPFTIHLSIHTSTQPGQKWSIHPNRELLSPERGSAASCSRQTYLNSEPWLWVTIRCVHVSMCL